MPTFEDGDTIVGPNTYRREGGVWVLDDGNGPLVFSDATINYLLTITVPVTDTNTARTTRETSSLKKERPYYEYRSAK